MAWDWENTIFNPYQSSYNERKRKLAENKQTAEAAESRDKSSWVRSYGEDAWNAEKNRRTQETFGWRKANPSLAGRNDAIKELQVPDGEEEMSFADFAAMFGQGQDGGAGNGFNAAAYVANLVNGINQSYDRRQETLGANRASSSQRIEGLANTYRQNLGDINQSYLQGISAQNQEIARRAAEQRAMAERTAQQLAGSLNAEGISAQPIQGQAQNIVNTLSTTNQFQRDLQDRMAQLAASSQAGSLASGELVRQGASGTLENNYNAMLNAMQSAREQEIMQAQQSAYGGGGGGGGGGGQASDPFDQAMKYLKGQQLFQEVMGGNEVDLASLMVAAAKKDPTGLIQAWGAMNPEQRKILGLG